MNEHESKLFLGSLKGGPNPFPNYTKNIWIRPFSDPPGHSEVFSHPFSACPQGASPHSDFCANLFICSQDLKFYDKNASLLGENQIWVKTESTIFGHFSMNFALLYGSCLTYYGVWALKIYGFWNYTRPTTLTSCYILLKVVKSPKKGIREAQSACVQQAIDTIYFKFCFLLYYTLLTKILHNLIFWHTLMKNSTL